MRVTFSIFLMTVVTITAFAANDIAQVRAGEARQMIKEGDKLVRRGQLAEAEKVFERAATQYPHASLIKVKLAYVYVKQRRLADAYELSLPVAKAEPRNAYAFAVLGATLLSAGRFAEAKALFSNAIQLDRKQALAWAGYGMLDFYENRIGDSLENLREAVYLEPEEADYVFAYAQVSARAESYKEAAEAYSRFLIVSRNTDDERRARIKGLINFLKYLGQKQSLYVAQGKDHTSVPVIIKGNRPIVQLRVNDKDEPLDFVLDTGSGISVISDKTAERLGIGRIAKGGYAKGLGGDGKFEIVYGFLREVAIGDVSIKNVPVYIRKFHQDGTEIDGYIGLSLISKFLTTLDYGSRTLTLARKDGDAAPVEAASLSLPLRLTSSGFLSGEVKLEGVDEPLNFIVDTGASVSVISQDVASLKDVQSYAQSEKMRVIGSAGITEDVASFLLPKVSFGAHTRKSITAIALDLDLINEASGFEQAGILGGNFLKNYRMTFDFKNSRVTFVPIADVP